MIELHIPHRYASLSFSKAKSAELGVFSNVSAKAISALACLGITERAIPGLDKCTAVLTLDIARVIVEEIDLMPDAVKDFRQQSGGDLHTQSEIHEVCKKYSSVCRSVGHSLQL